MRVKDSMYTWSYGLVEGVPFAESPFTVESDGNVLTNTFTLNWETRSFYQFTVRATDAGSPPMTVRNTTMSYLCSSCSCYIPQAIAEVNVTVLDLNDNAPMFPAQPYSKVTPENNIGPNGNITEILLLRVEADDADMPGPNSTVRYSISSGANGIFSINANTVKSLKGVMVTLATLALYRVTSLLSASWTLRVNHLTRLQ